MSLPLSYNDYLKTDALTQLQNYQSDPPHHDESLFIIIHQAYELWFKQLLHEIDIVLTLINADKIRRAVFYMRRILAIWKLLVQQIHILETMSAKDFLHFRNHLNPASGFQSSQFREIEFASGLKDSAILAHFRSDAVAYENLCRRYQAPSLLDCFYAMLRRKGFALPDDQLDQRISELLEIYMSTDIVFADLHDLAETLIEYDELISFWRVHHVMVVERIIGLKKGTGGSEGVAYLYKTLEKRMFPDLWHLRTYLAVE